MRIEVEIKQKPRKNDITIFTGEKWEVVSINKFLNEINNRIDKVEQKVSDIETDIKLIKGE